MNPLIFQEQLDLLIKNSNLYIDLIYFILKSKTLQLEKVYREYNQDLILKQQQKKMKIQKENKNKELINNE